MEEDQTFQKEVALKTLVYKAYRYVCMSEGCVIRHGHWESVCITQVSRFPDVVVICSFLFKSFLLSFCFRCFFIAQSYVLVKKWSEALVLYERVLKYAQEVQSKAKSLNNSLKVEQSQQLLRILV